MSRILCDTSAYIAAGKNHPIIGPLLRRTDEIAISAVSIGEILAGIRKGSDRFSRVNEKALQEFLGSPRVTCAPVTQDTAACYAAIKDGLRRAGTALAANDLWIAAGAMEHGLRLVTTDSDFLRIPQILVDHYAPESTT